MDVPNARFRMVGGHPVFDFTNTASWYRAGALRGREPLDRVGKERLVVGGDLVRWGVAAGLLPARSAPRDPSSEMLHRARRLRLALYHLFKAVTEGWRADRPDIDVLDEEARSARLAQRLAANGEGWRLEWRDAPGPEEIILRTVATSALELLVSPDLAQVKQCPGEDCGWLFLDTSRNHKRRWCEMADCGNLAKVRRFRGQRTGRSGNR